MNYWRMGVCVSGLLLLTVAGPSVCRAREIIVGCSTPTPGYHIQIERVWEVDGEIWVVSRIEGQGAAIQVIGSAEGSVDVDIADDAVVKHFISGKTWGWWRGVEATMIDSREALEEQMEEDEIEIDEVLYDSDAADN